MVRNGPSTDTEEEKKTAEKEKDTETKTPDPDVLKKDKEDRTVRFGGDFSKENILKEIKKIEPLKEAKDYEEAMKFLKDGNDDKDGLKSGRNSNLYSWILENKKKFENDKAKEEIKKKKDELNKDEPKDKKKPEEKKSESKDSEKKPDEKKGEKQKEHEKKPEVGMSESKNSEKSDEDEDNDGEENEDKWREEDKKSKKKKEKKSEKSEEDEDDEADDKSEKSDRKGFFGSIGSFLGKTSTQAGNLIRYIPRTAWNSGKMFLRSLKYFGFDILNFPSGEKAMKIISKKYSDDMKKYKETFKWNYKKGGK